MLIDFADLLQTDVYWFRFPHTQMEFGLCLHETEHGAQVGLSPRTHLQPEGEADRPVAVHQPLRLADGVRRPAARSPFPPLPRRRWR